MMTHEEIKADLSLLALGTLDPDEQRVIEAHLRDGCAECERELESWHEVVGLMPLELGNSDAPNLKSALLERVRPASPPASAPRTAKVIRLPRWSLVPLAAAATLVIAFGIVRMTGLQRALEEQRQLVARVQAELDVTQGELQRVSTALAAKENDVTSLRAALAAAQESLAIVQAPGLRMVKLKETPEQKPAEGHVLFDPRGGRALFYGFELPPVPQDKTYELWWITEKQGPINAGVFHPNERGLGRVDMPVPTDAGAIQAAAVTIEPAGGTEKPTGPMVLLGAFKG